MSVLTYYTGGNVKQTRAAKAQALRDLERAHDKKIKDAIHELERIKVRALRVEKRATIKDMRAEHKRMIEKVRQSFDDKIAALLKEAGEHRTRLGSSRLSRKHQKQREKGRATGAEARQELDEQVENDVMHWRPELAPLWRKIKVGFATRPGMSRFESFQHWIHENPDAIEAMQEAQERMGSEIDLACAEAKDLSQRGDSEAEAWHVENCGRPVSAISKKPKAKKSSAASRTASLYGSGETPAPAQKKAEPKPPKKKGPKKAAKGQQDLTTGTMRARKLTDEDFDQIPF